MRHGFRLSRRALEKATELTNEAGSNTHSEGNVKDNIAQTGMRVTRRTLLAAAPLVAAAVGLGPTRAVAAAAAAPVKPANTDKFPPLSPFKFSLEKSTSGWKGAGGTAKEVNTSNFPISKSIAGVSMRLQPGGLRELHWHAVAAEWAYIIEGHIMTTVIAPDGTVEKNEFGPGDTWYFPRGHGHALQGLGPGECHFLLGFDNGDFSEFGTFSVTDWIARTPPGISARTMQLPESTVASLPKGEVYIVQGKVPKVGEPFRNASLEPSQLTHKYRLGAAAPIRFAGGEERIVSSVEFPIQSTLTSARMDLEPGALREMHWHPNSDEWQYYTKGRGRVGIFGAHGRVETAEFGPGDVGFIPQGFGHWVEQLGGDATQVVILFNNPLYTEISLSQWLAANPASMLKDNFGVTAEVIDKLPKAALGIAGKATRPSIK
jgi:oxalate decarboxylase